MTASRLLLFPLFLSVSLLACDEKGIDTPDTTDTTDTNDDDDDDDVPATDIAGDDIDTAYEVAWEEGAFSVEEIIGDGGDRDFYAIPMTSGTSVTVMALSYALDGVSEPDTVIRLYDDTGTLLAENDDMPYRLLETDSALFFEATYTGNYYLEVLEWGDWAGEGGNGGISYEYTVQGYEIDSYESEPINNVPEDVAEYVAQDGVYAFVSDPFTGENTMMYGDISAAGDVDYYPLTIPAPTKTPYNGLFYAVSFFGQPLGNLTPDLAIVDADGNVIAQTFDPFYNVDRISFYEYRSFYYDFGLLAYLTPGEYFIRVQDTDETVSGDGTFYAGILSGFYDSFAPSENDQDQNQILNGAPLELDEENFYTTVSNSVGVDGDDLDSWAINVGSVPLSDKYLDVFVMAEQYGSLLDAKVTIYDADGATVLHTASTNDYDGGADPEFRGLPISSDDIFVVVEPEDENGVSLDELANNYILYVSVNDTP